MPTFSCDLTALDAQEQQRRTALAARVSSRFLEVQELTDGYAAALENDDALVRDALDWLLLERRCCPFLRLELSFEPSGGVVWFRMMGADGVKEFLSAAGIRTFSRGA